MKFKQAKYLYHYEVIANGESLGQVWKTQRHGYNYWRNGETNQLFTTRRDAGLHLIGTKGAK